MAGVKKRWEFVDRDVDFIQVYVPGGRSFRVRILFRIRALIDDPLGRFKTGDLGGYVEREENLPQGENGWVADAACVYGNARVTGGATISEYARMFGNARVFGGARIYGSACVFGNAQVYDNAEIFGKVRICGDWRIGGDSCIWGEM